MFQSSSLNDLPVLTWDHFIGPPISAAFVPDIRQPPRRRPQSAGSFETQLASSRGVSNVHGQRKRPATALASTRKGAIQELNECMVQRPGANRLLRYGRRQTRGSLMAKSIPQSSSSSSHQYQQQQQQQWQQRTSYQHHRNRQLSRGREIHRLRSKAQQSSLESIASVLDNMDVYRASKLPLDQVFLDRISDVRTTRPLSAALFSTTKGDRKLGLDQHMRTFAWQSGREEQSSTNSVQFDCDPTYSSQLFGASLQTRTSSPNSSDTSRVPGLDSTMLLSHGDESPRCSVQVLGLEIAAFSWKMQRKHRQRCLHSVLMRWSQFIQTWHEFTASVSLPFYTWKKYRAHRLNGKVACEQLRSSFFMLRLKMILRTWLHHYRHENSLRKRMQLQHDRKQRSFLSIILNCWRGWSTTCFSTRRDLLHTMLKKYRVYQLLQYFIVWNLFSHCRSHIMKQRTTSVVRARLRSGCRDDLPRHKALDMIPSPPHIHKLEAFYKRSQLETKRAQNAIDFWYTTVLSSIVTEWYRVAWADKKVRNFRYNFSSRRCWRQWHAFIEKCKRQRVTRAELYKAKQSAFQKRERSIRERAESEAAYDLKTVRESRKLRKAAVRRGLTRAGAEAAFVELARNVEQQHTDAILNLTTVQHEAGMDEHESDGAESSRIATTTVHNVQDSTDPNSSFPSEREEDSRVHPDIIGAVGSILQHIEIEAKTIESVRLIRGLEGELDQLRGHLFELESAVRSRRLADPDDPDMSMLIEQAFQMRVHCTEIEEAIEMERQSHHNAILCRSNSSNKTSIANEDSQRPSDSVRSDSPRRTRYGKLLLGARDNIDSSAAHVSRLQRRNHELSTEIERMQAFQLQLKQLAASRGKEFQQHLCVMKTQGMQAALAAGEQAKRHLWAMLEQWCYAVGIAFDSIANSRRRNTTILAFLRLARPVQIQKARKHFEVFTTSVQFGTWRRYTAMMKSIRETAHVRFRCCYSSFKRWKQAARLNRIYRTRGLRWEIMRRKQLLCLFSSWMTDSPLDASHHHRYTCLAKWAEYTQQRVGRRHVVALHNMVTKQRLLRRAFVALFLGLKPVHQGKKAADGYIERNFVADIQLWQHLLRAELHLVTRHQRMIYRSYRRHCWRSASCEAARMPRQRLQRAAMAVNEQMKLDQATVLAAYAGDEQLHTLWPTIFQRRSSRNMACLALAKQGLDRFVSSIQLANIAHLRPVIRSSIVGVGTLLWLLRARISIQSRTHSYEKLIRQARASIL